MAEEVVKLSDKYSPEALLQNCTREGYEHVVERIR